MEDNETESKENMIQKNEQDNSAEETSGAVNKNKENNSTEENKEKGEGLLIVLDSGHGGFDPGKIGINGALEKDVNLIIAKKVEKYLKKQGYTVIMTRENDEGVADSKVEDLKARVSLINDKKPVIAVSIHQNSYS